MGKEGHHPCAVTRIKPTYGNAVSGVTVFQQIIIHVLISSTFQSPTQMSLLLEASLDALS